MKIQVLGAGCPSCKTLHNMTIRAVKELGIDTDVEYISGNEGTMRIVELGIMSSPVLVVNGNPVMVGFSPDMEKLKNVLRKALN